MDRPAIGTAAWLDMTLDDADQPRDFYKEVVGWEHGEVDMDGYSDDPMNPAGAEVPAADICHRRG